MGSQYNVENDALAANDFAEIEQQVDWLIRAISREKVHLEALREDVENSELKLHRFLKEYLQEVGVPVARRECLKGLWSFGGDAEQSRAAKKQMPVYSEANARKLYRTLAKVYHPDNKEHDGALSRYFPLLKQAYEQGDLKTLAWLDVLASEAAQWEKELCIVTRLEYLEQRYQHILKEKDALLKQRHRIINSAEWELMERVESFGHRRKEVVQRIRDAVMEEVRVLENRTGLVSSVL